LRNHVESVLDNDNECTNFSEDEVGAEVSFWVVTMNQVRKIVKEKMMTSQAFLTCSNYDAEKTE
jgi:hypothetical protein